MQILHIIFTISMTLAFWSVAFFVFHTTKEIREIKRAVDGTRRSVKTILTISLGTAVRENFEEVNRMKRAFAHLIETEQYEEAEKLQEAIGEAEQTAVKSLEVFKSIDSEMTKVIVTSVKDRHAGEE